MPRCLYCLGWYLSETDDAPLGSACECGEMICEDDQREAVARAEASESEVIAESEK